MPPLLREYHPWWLTLISVSFRDRLGLLTTKAPRETTSMTTRTSTQAPALAVSVWRWAPRLHTHALILLNATAAGFQSLDPQDPPPPPRDMAALFTRKAVRTLAHITDAHISPQAASFFFFFDESDVVLFFFQKHVKLTPQAANRSRFPQILFAVIRLQHAQIRRLHARRLSAMAGLRLSELCVRVCKNYLLNIIRTAVIQADFLICGSWRCPRRAATVECALKINYNSEQGRRPGPPPVVAGAPRHIAVSQPVDTEPSDAKGARQMCILRPPPP